MKISNVEAEESGRSRAEDSDWLVGEDSDGPEPSSSWLSWVSAVQTANLNKKDILENMGAAHEKTFS